MGRDRGKEDRAESGGGVKSSGGRRERSGRKERRQGGMKEGQGKDGRKNQKAG